MALVGKPDRKITLGIPKCRWEDNIKTDLQEVEWRCMDRTALAQDRARWRVLVSAVKIFFSHTRPRPPCGSLNFHYLLCKRTHPYPVDPPSNWFKLFLSQSLSHMDTPTILKFSHYLPTCLRRWNRESVSKRRHIKFRRRGITQKKTYKIQDSSSSIKFRELLD
jgi:hypothetical protein